MLFPFENMLGPRDGGSRPIVHDSLVRTRKLALALKAQAAKEREVGLSPRENANQKPWIPFDRSFDVGEVNKPNGLATAARNLIADVKKKTKKPRDFLSLLEQQTSDSSKKLKTEVMIQLLRDTESELVGLPPSLIEEWSPGLFGAWRERMRFNIQDAIEKIRGDSRLADVLRPMTNVFKKGGPGAAQAAQAYSDGLWKLMTFGQERDPKTGNLFVDKDGNLTMPHSTDMEVAVKFSQGKPFRLTSAMSGFDPQGEPSLRPDQYDAKGHANEGLPPLILERYKKMDSKVQAYMKRNARFKTYKWPDQMLKTSQSRGPHPEDTRIKAFRARKLDRNIEETDSGLRIMFKGKVPLPEKDQPRVAGELLQGLNSAEEAAFLERVRAEQTVGKKGMAAALKRIRPEMGRKAQRLMDAKEGRKALLLGEEMGVGRDLLREVVADRKVARELMGNLIGLEHLAKYGRAGASALGKSGRGAKILGLLKLGQMVL